MHPYYTTRGRGFELYPLEQLYADLAADPKAGKREILYSSTDPKIISDPDAPLIDPGVPAFVLYKDDVSVVASRNIRENVRHSLEIAMRMAMESPAVVSGFVGTGDSHHEPVWGIDPRYIEEEPDTSDPTPKRRSRYSATAKPGTPGAYVPAKDPHVLYLNGYAGKAMIGEEIAWLKEHRGIVDRKDMPFCILHSPFGCWSKKVHELRRAVVNNQINVIVVNAFEWLSITSREKMEIVADLLDLKEKFGVTLIVFSQDVRKQMEPGMQSRGALGMLTGCAGTVVKIEDPKPKEDPLLAIDKETARIQKEREKLQRAGERREARWQAAKRLREGAASGLKPGEEWASRKEAIRDVVGEAFEEQWNELVREAEILRPGETPLDRTNRMIRDGWVGPDSIKRKEAALAARRKAAGLSIHVHPEMKNEFRLHTNEPVIGNIVRMPVF